MWHPVYCDSNSSVLVGPETRYSTVPAMQYLGRCQTHLYHAALIGETHCSVPWGWHSDTAVIDGAGCAVTVPVTDGSTCAAADAASSSIAADMADQADEAMVQSGTVPVTLSWKAEVWRRPQRRATGTDQEYIGNATTNCGPECFWKTGFDAGNLKAMEGRR